MIVNEVAIRNDKKYVNLQTFGIQIHTEFVH